MDVLGIALGVGSLIGVGVLCSILFKVYKRITASDIKDIR